MYLYCQGEFDTKLTSEWCQSPFSMWVLDVLYHWGHVLSLRTTQQLPIDHYIQGSMLRMIIVIINTVYKCEDHIHNIYKTNIKICLNYIYLIVQ